MRDQKPTTVVVPQIVQIRRVDPDFKTGHVKEIEYDFGPKGRLFTADPVTRGSYGHGFDTGFSAGFDSQISNREG